MLMCRDGSISLAEAIGLSTPSTVRNDDVTLSVESQSELKSKLAEQYRQLQIRARYFEALAVFERERGSDDGVDGACRAAAAAVKCALELSAAAVFCTGGPDRPGRVALADEAGTRSELRSETADGPAPRGSQNRRGEPDGEPTLCSSRCDGAVGGGTLEGTVWDRGPFWTMALFDRGQWVGAAIISANESDMARRP